MASSRVRSDEDQDSLTGPSEEEEEEGPCGAAAAIMTDDHFNGRCNINIGCK